MKGIERSSSFVVSTAHTELPSVETDMDVRGVVWEAITTDTLSELFDQLFFSAHSADMSVIANGIYHAYASHRDKTVLGDLVPALSEYQKYLEKNGQTQPRTTRLQSAFVEAVKKYVIARERTKYWVTKESMRLSGQIEQAEYSRFQRATELTRASWRGVSESVKRQLGARPQLIRKILQYIGVDEDKVMDAVARHVSSLVENSYQSGVVDDHYRESISDTAWGVEISSIAFGVTAQWDLITQNLEMNRRIIIDMLQSEQGSVAINPHSR